jgi:N-methylhydantoinase B
MTTTTIDYDPVSVEIHRRALDNITAEMAITLTQTSGSPVVYEVKDFATCLMDADGEHLSMSSAVIFHAASSLFGTEAVIAAARARGEIRPGDGWIVNDPFTAGAMHQADVTIIMPQFYDGSHVGWAFSNVHVADIGGMGVSGFAPGAVSVYDEGLRFGPTLIMSDGQVDPGWEAHFRSNVRVAELVLNDIRGMIAANNVAQTKLTEVIDRFGIERFQEYCDINKRLSEEALRKRIEKLPDGTYEAAEWIEFDGHGEDLLFEIRGVLEVDGSTLRFKLSGDPQGDAFINGTKGVVVGNVMTAVLTTLSYGDLPFNAGMWRPLEIDLGEPGTVVNAQVPVPVSAGHATAGLRVVRMVKELLNQAFALSDDPVIRGRVGGAAADAVGLYPLAGMGHNGIPTVLFFMDNTTGSGGGAQSMADGQECYGATPLAGVGLPSVETNEATAPALYLWRRLVPNSGGPGTYRGGQALETQFALYGTDRLAGAMTLLCAEAPPLGVGGGLTAGTGSWDATYESNFDEMLAKGEMPTEGSLTGRTPEVPSHLGRLFLGRGDLLRVSCIGGGGAGDPLQRDPDLVAKDVRDGYITETNARAAYGVLISDEGQPLETETRVERERIRRERIGGEPSREMEKPEVAGVSLALGSDGDWHCTCCDGGLGPISEDWREQAVSEVSGIGEVYAALDMFVRERKAGSPVMIEQHCCPECAALLMVRAYPSDAPRLNVPRHA